MHIFRDFGLEIRKSLAMNADLCALLCIHKFTYFPF